MKVETTLCGSPLLRPTSFFISIRLRSSNLQPMNALFCFLRFIYSDALRTLKKRCCFSSLSLMEDKALLNRFWNIGEANKASSFLFSSSSRICLLFSFWDVGLGDVIGRLMDIWFFPLSAICNLFACPR